MAGLTAMESEAQHRWLTIAEQHDAAGKSHKAKLARYMAALAAGDPNAISLAPERIRKSKERSTQSRSRNSTVLPVAAFLGLLAASQAHAQPLSCETMFVGGQAPSLLDASLRQDTYPICYHGFMALDSGVTRDPDWSAERLTAEDVLESASMRRDGRFHDEESIPDGHRADLADYRHLDPPYDRGHMTPSGDEPDDIAQQESFTLGNVVPQTPALNRGVWEHVEEITRNLAREDGEVYVVTGPAFNSTAHLAGGERIPSATWKAIYDPKRNGAAAFECQNVQVAPTCVLEPVVAIENEVGIDPFPALSDQMKGVALALPMPESGRTYAYRQRRMQDVYVPPPPPRSWLDRLMSAIFG